MQIRVFSSSEISIRNEKSYIFFKDSVTRAPLLIFCHGFADQYQAYYELINHCVNNGFVVLYTDTQKVTFTRNKLREFDFGIPAILQAVHLFPYIDTSRILILGHAFGAGAAPGLMLNLKKMNWGDMAACMYLMSPWYLYSIDERQMTSFPDKTKLIVQVFENDNYNDPMIAADMFSLIGIPADKKTFFIVKEDTCKPFTFKVNHLTPYGNGEYLGELNAMDTLAIFSIIDSLSRKEFAQGHSSGFFSGNGTHDYTMRTRQDGDSVPPMVITDKPFKYIPNGPYLNPWNSLRNPRIDINKFRKKHKIMFRFKVNRFNQVTKYIAQKIKVTKELEKKDTEFQENPIDSGFGANGPFLMKEVTFANPDYADLSVSLFTPDSVEGRVPVLLFLHGYNGGNPMYFSHLIPHIVSKGIAVLFPTYSAFPTVNDSEKIVTKYAMLYSGIEAAFSQYGDVLDTTRVGIFGHSFGGGAVPWIAHKMLVEKGWGSNAAFMFISAPWYVYGMDSLKYSQLPDNLKAVIVTYSDDLFNDHQMAADLFYRLPVPLSEKRFFLFSSDTSGSDIMPANHFVPYGVDNIYGLQNNLDYFGVFKIFDAELAYSLYGDPDGKLCALGNNNDLQTWCGVWPDGKPVKKLKSTDSPKVTRSEKTYVFAWDNPLNLWRTIELPRREKSVSDNK